MCTVLQTLVHLLWCSAVRSWTLRCNQQYFLKHFSWQPNNGLDSNYTTARTTPCTRFHTVKSGTLDTYFYQQVSKVQETVNTGKYLFIDVLDGVTKTSKVKSALKRSYRVLGTTQHFMFIHRKELVEWTQLVGGTRLSACWHATNTTRVGFSSERSRKELEMSILFVP